MNVFKSFTNKNSNQVKVETNGPSCWDRAECEIWCVKRNVLVWAESGEPSNRP